MLQMPPEEEIVVMQGVLDGLKDQTIARRLGVSLITVRRRVGRFIQHVGAKNRIQAAVIGVREGWLRLRLEGPVQVNGEVESHADEQQGDTR